MTITWHATLETLRQYRQLVEPRVGRGDLEESLDLVKLLLQRLPHGCLLAASKEEIKAAGRTMMAEGQKSADMKKLQNALVMLFDIAYKKRLVSTHPVRGVGVSQPEGEGVQPATLVVGFAPAAVEQLRSLLKNRAFEIADGGSPTAARDAIALYPFSFLLCRHPLAGVDSQEFLDRVRGEHSLCRRAGLILMAAAEDLDSARHFVGRGANRVLGFDRVSQELEATLDELSLVDRRVELRMMVRAREDGNDTWEVWQSENLSATGMLLRSPRLVAAGSLLDLEFTLPRDSVPIRVRSEVVRETVGAREKLRGVGVRFLSFEETARFRLDAFLGQGS